MEQFTHTNILTTTTKLLKNTPTRHCIMLYFPYNEVIATQDKLLYTQIKKPGQNISTRPLTSISIHIPFYSCNIS